MQTILLGFQYVFSDPMCIALLALGVFVGIIFGSIPGLTATLGVTLFIPFTYTMQPVQGLVMLIAVYVGGISGGLITATLINIPGTPSSIYTCFDGYPMTKKGKPAQALAIGVFCSLIGGSRLTFGFWQLQGGISSTALMMGLFAITEVFNQSLELHKPRPKIEFKKTTLIPPFSEMKSCWKAIGIGCVIGTGIGILPGIGQNASTLISYNLARTVSKTPEEFGHGCPEGICASETSNNATNGGALILLVCLGIDMAPVILGFILGPLIEKYMRMALISANGNWADMFNRPVSVFFVVIAILFVVVPVIKKAVSQGKKKA